MFSPAWQFEGGLDFIALPLETVWLLVARPLGPSMLLPPALAAFQLKPGEFLLDPGLG